METDSSKAHVVALSGGKDSTAMALRLVEIEPETHFRFICTPTGNELPDMIDHWATLKERLGNLSIITGGQSLGSLIKKWNALPNWRQRWCTRVLKIEPFRQYIATVAPAVVYVGIRADEEDREGVQYEGDIEVRFPLVEWGWGLADVQDYLSCKGITIPERTDCAACFFQTLGEWYALWKNHPEKYKQAEDWEETTGYTFRSPSRDTQPASLAALRKKFEGGYAPKPSRMSDRTVMCGTCAR